MQDRRDSRQEGGRKVEIQKSVGMEGCSKGGIQDWKDSGPEGYIKGGI